MGTETRLKMDREGDAVELETVKQAEEEEYEISQEHVVEESEQVYGSQMSQDSGGIAIPGNLTEEVTLNGTSMTEDDEGDQPLNQSRQMPYREQDIFLPIANVARIMKNSIPPNGKIAKEAKECVQECVSEFISFITSEAAERCQQEKRKTINGEDILFALTTLGFEPYVEPLKIYLGKYRDSIKGDKIDDNQEEISINTPQIVQIAGESGSTQHVIIQENGQIIQTADGHQLVFKTD